MNSRNPVLSDKYFRQGGMQDSALSGRMGSAATSFGGANTESARTMSFGGIASATGFMLMFVIVGAWFGWGRVLETRGLDSLGRTLVSTSMPTGWLIGSGLTGFVLVLICTFRPPLARFLAIPYSIAEGIFLGIITHMYDAQTNGIALQAVIATLAVFLVMLAMYGLRILRVTPKMFKAVTAATLGIAAMYLVGFVASLFGADFRFWNDASPLGIGISLVIVGVAAFNLLLDFDFIERGVANRAPAHMEWFAALGLIVTIVWLYLEMLRLLSKLNRR